MPLACAPACMRASYEHAQRDFPHFTVHNLSLLESEETIRANSGELVLGSNIVIVSSSRSRRQRFSGQARQLPFPGWNPLTYGTRHNKKAGSVETQCPWKRSQRHPHDPHMAGACVHERPPGIPIQTLRAVEELPVRIEYQRPAVYGRTKERP